MLNAWFSARMCEIKLEDAEQSDPEIQGNFKIINSNSANPEQEHNNNKRIDQKEDEADSTAHITNSDSDSDSEAISIDLNQQQKFSQIQQIQKSPLLTYQSTLEAEKTVAAAVSLGGDDGDQKQSKLVVGIRDSFNCRAEIEILDWEPRSRFAILNRGEEESNSSFMASICLVRSVKENEAELGNIVEDGGAEDSNSAEDGAAFAKGKRTAIAPATVKGGGLRPCGFRCVFPRMAKPPPLLAAVLPWDSVNGIQMRKKHDEAAAAGVVFPSGDGLDGGTRGYWLVPWWVAFEEEARKKKEKVTEGEDLLAPVTGAAPPVVTCLGRGVAGGFAHRTFWKEVDGEGLLGLYFKNLGLNV